MNLTIKKGDIVEEKVDAIVNAANSALTPGGGVDGAITKAAGLQALIERKDLHGCPTGEAKIASAGYLDAKYIIYTVGPKHSDNQPELLAGAYRNSVKIALENKCESIAFPAISAGVYGFSPEEAADIALDTVMEFRKEDIKIKFVLFTDDVFEAFKEKFAQLKEEYAK
jgi:O-acetyl-ADP-ribose deacetylase (regulator of RNase III)